MPLALAPLAVVDVAVGVGVLPAAVLQVVLVLALVLRPAGLNVNTNPSFINMRAIWIVCDVNSPLKSIRPSRASVRPPTRPRTDDGIDHTVTVKVSVGSSSHLHFKAQT